MNGYHFTDGLRQVLAQTREEAARLSHDYVGTEHLLLGLLRTERGRALAVLRSLSANTDQLREHVMRSITMGRSSASGPDIPYTSRSKRVLELAMSFALEIGDGFTGTEHLLLGLAAEPDGVAGQVLRAKGLTLDLLRAHAISVRYGVSLPPGMRGDPTSTEAFLELAQASRGHFQLESGHHGGLWLDLDALFVDSRVDPFVAALAHIIRPLRVDAVCGPLLGGAFLAQAIARTLRVQFWHTERVMPSGSSGLYPASYRLPDAIADRAAGKRCAIVDDVMSAGSALRGTYAALRAERAIPVFAGALLVLGDAGIKYFASEGVPVEGVAWDDYALWLPDDCPLCKEGVKLQRIV